MAVKILTLMILSFSIFDYTIVAELPMVQLGGRSYNFSTNTLSWYDAQTFCRSHGLELAILETREENRLVVEHKYKVIGRFATFLGGTDEESEGSWRWSATGQTLGFTNWFTYQPDGGRMENCMYIGNRDVSRGAWCDAPCSRSHYYICEAK